MTPKTYNDEFKAAAAKLVREQGYSVSKAALEALKSIPPVFEGTCLSREGLRAKGRALEAKGDDRAAAESYRRLVELGSKAAQGADCRKCHQSNGLAADFWLRDWQPGSRTRRSSPRSTAWSSAVIGAPATTHRSVRRC